MSEPFHDKAIEICKIEARLEACEPADPSRATLQASLDTLALQQKESKLANLDQLSTQYMCKPESVCWLYRPPRSFHALDLAVSQDRLDERYKDALSMLPDDIFSTVCKVPTIKASGKKRKKKNTNCVGESNSSAKHLNNPERIAKLAEHFDKKDHDAKVLADKQQAKHTRDRFLQYFLFSKCTGYMTKPTEKLTLAHIDAFMTSQKLRFPSTAVKRSRDDKVDWLSEYVQNFERSHPNHAWIANTVTMDGKVKKTMKAVNTTDVSAAKGASTVTAVESDSGTGSDAE